MKCHIQPDCIELRPENDFEKEWLHDNFEYYQTCYTERSYWVTKYGYDKDSDDENDYESPCVTFSRVDKLEIDPTSFGVMATTKGGSNGKKLDRVPKAEGTVGKARGRD